MVFRGGGDRGDKCRARRLNLRLRCRLRAGKMINASTVQGGARVLIEFVIWRQFPRVPRQRRSLGAAAWSPLPRCRSATQYEPT